MSYIISVLLDETTEIKDYVFNFRIYQNKELDGNIVDYVDLYCSPKLTQDFILSDKSSIRILRGNTTANKKSFFGYISRKAPTGSLIVITVRNPLWLLDRDQITYTFDSDIDPEGGKISSLAESIIEGSNFVSLTADVTDSGDESIITTFICDGDSRLERVNYLRKFISWQTFYKYSTDTVVFQPFGSTVYQTTLEVGKNILNVPIWTKDIEQVINQVIVKGATQNDNTTELFSGDGSTKVFTLSYTPIDIRVEVGGTLKVLGIDDVTTTFDYTLNKYKKQITFTTAPGSGSNNISVTYTYGVPIRVNLRDNPSVSAYGISTYRKESEDITTMEEAETKAQKIIDLFKEPPETADLQVVGIYDLYVGDQVKIIDNANGKTGTYFVQNITSYYPEGYDVVKVSTRNIVDPDNIFNSMIQRIKDLERKLERNADIITQIDSSESQLEIHGYDKLLSASPETDVLYWDDDNQGDWDDYDWGDDSEETTTVQSIVHINRVYFEDFMNTDFKDSINTTGTWNGDGVLTLTNGQKATTTVFAKDGSNTFSTVTVFWDCLDNDITVKISGNGGTNKETVENGVPYNLINKSSAGLVLEITNNTGDTVTFTQLSEQYIKVVYS